MLSTNTVPVFAPTVHWDWSPYLSTSYLGHNSLQSWLSRRLCSVDKFWLIDSYFELTSADISHISHQIKQHLCRQSLFFNLLRCLISPKKTGNMLIFNNSFFHFFFGCRKGIISLLCVKQVKGCLAEMPGLFQVAVAKTEPRNKLLSKMSVQFE